jgi:adenylate kinase family enzyme
MTLSSDRIPGPRIVVVGVTGSGKTTTAFRLSKILTVPHIELDALHWLPNWVQTEREVFRQKVSEALAGPVWVTDGNYRKARDLIWSRATTLVWLDYTLPVILWQLTWRSFRRIITREELWGGNRETLRGLLFSKDSLYLWAFQSHARFQALYPQELAAPENAHLQVIRFKNRQETDQWLLQLEKEIARKMH